MMFDADGLVTILILILLVVLVAIGAGTVIGWIL